MASMFKLALQLAVALAALPQAIATPHANGTYDYIVIGSGPGGSITATNLALAGQSVLLIEAGRDATGDLSTEIAALSFPGTPDLRWSFFVKHYSNQTQELRYNHLTWLLPDGSYWVGSGARAPPDAKLLGVYYPRGATLGGSAIVNAMGTLLPNDADWDYIANITGDASWKHDGMRAIFEKVERNHYLPTNTPGHGFTGFMDTYNSRSSYYNRTPGKVAQFKTLVSQLGGDPSQIFSLLERDVNYVSDHRDTDNGEFGLPSHTDQIGRRWSPRDMIKATANATNSDGSKKYRLTVQTDSLATRVLFSRGDASAKAKPRATGVEFLEGRGVYKGTWKYDPKAAPKGVRKAAYAAKEVVVAGGAFNSPQILQLSGIGDQKHLQALGIDVVIHLPGVGANLRDNQELPVVGHGAGNFTAASDPSAAVCTNGAQGDPCVDLWRQGQGPYAGPRGNSECTIVTTKHSPNGKRDLLMFGAPAVFRGFWPATNQTDPGLFTDPPNTTWSSIVRMTSVNRAGYVRIRSADPTDTPDINLEHYGNDAETDLGAVEDAVALMRRVFADIPAPYGPVVGSEPPCPAGYGADGYCKDHAQDRQWILDQTFGHHAAGTCAIGADGDPLAVLDAAFRVRGVDGLRVVDASVFPLTPGAFPVLATAMVAQKASAVILAGGA
ncbi:alcohol oxidase [Thozetella sp. PMI_491]|nr:alcohol oxidase [Thozetella sp. PMI_491]